MEEKEFYKLIAKDYFEGRSTDLKMLKYTISNVLPVFGSLKVDIVNEDNGSKKLTFTDVDRADAVISSDNKELSEEDLDMSCSILKLTTNKNGIITIVEHDINMFTLANKETVLFLGGLIGKKIVF